ncbi:hypothetical protein HOK51_08205 [Candidatus Woesearchaeota archaeon]|jgi:hypothetical protein|nr:hypothetical protein [Candidatus Woesearchaeota archaeon]MBT6519807.1 hypothetical protein [Candidatus Woesearchaeota archaeon]MBT7368186.1 hypothetical protein [Candidatus Woesearchaeota archaeon]
MTEGFDLKLEDYDLTIDKLVDKLKDTAVTKNSNSRGGFGPYTTEYETYFDFGETKFTLYVRKHRFTRDPSRDEDPDGGKRASLKNLLIRPLFGVFNRVENKELILPVKYLSQKESKKLFKAMQTQYENQTHEMHAEIKKYWGFEK